MEVKIEKIVLSLGEKELALTIEEARKLKQVLSDLLDNNKPEIQIYPIPYPQPVPIYPVWPYQTICSGDTITIS